MMPKNLCPNCMAGYLNNGVCSSCGRRVFDEARSADALPLGFHLKDYILGRVLGKGGFGITYLAWDNRRNIRVAVKELFPNSYVERNRTGFVSLKIRDKDTTDFFQHVCKRFQEEAELVKNLSSYPEIIRIYDAFQDLGTSYYVMEYLDGMDLSMWCARLGHVTWSQLEKPIQDTLQSLRILHRNGLIHRDISPDNIFLLRNGSTKLIDFGSVRSEHAPHFTTILKKEFAPWEQFTPNGDQGAWTDTFSLCASLYYMLSGGEKPVRADIRYEDWKTKGKDLLVPLKVFSPAAPAYVIDAVMKGMSIPLDARFRSVDKMKSAFFPASEIPFSGSRSLICIGGLYAGRIEELSPGRGLSLGRGTGNNIFYPDETRGISRKQCEIFVDLNGVCYVRDLRSRFGTFLNGQRLRPMEWTRIRENQVLTIGADSYRIR